MKNAVVLRTHDNAHEQSVIGLWRETLSDGAPHHDPGTTIQKKLAVERDLFFVAEAEQTIVGTVMGGYDGHHDRICSFAVAPPRRGGGTGRALVARIEAALRERGCLKVNLQVRASNAGVVAFYQKLGYGVEERTSMGKRLYE